MKNLASTLVFGAACAALSCSGGKSMTGSGGSSGTAGDGGGTAGSSGTAGTSGAAGTGGAAGGRGGAAVGGSGGNAAGGRGGTTATGTGGTGGTPVAGDPCRGTALPTNAHYVPSGMCARTIATGQSGLRQITFSSNGDLWGVTANGQIKRFRDTNGDGVYQSGEITNWASTGGNGQNVHIDEAGGYLYSGTSSGVRRWMWSNTIDSGGTGQDVMTGQPGNGNHPKHTVHVWDNWMYVQSGSSGNVSSSSATSYDTGRNLIKRFNLASFSGTALNWMSGGEVFVDGTRNILGFNRDAMGRMYGVQNGQDDVTYGGSDVHNDNPGEVIIRLEAGSHHGYPFCFAAQRINNVAPGTQVRSEIFSNNQRDDAWCQNTTNVARPVTFVQAHTAPMEIIFFLPTLPAGALPEKWRNGAFVSLHGSWNRTPATGFKVIWVPFNADGTSPLPTNSGNSTTFPYEVVLSGGNASGSTDGMWNISGGEMNVRPVGLAISPIDGALYISSDSGGYLYRVGTQR
jgi:glucose/arabinose dehydrogenase